MKLKPCISPVWMLLTCLNLQVNFCRSLVSAVMTGKHLTIGSANPAVVPGKLRLYAMRFCPYSQRVYLVLLAKQIPFDPVFINLKAKPEWYQEQVPTGKVPAVLVDGHNVYESLITADFLDEKYSQRPLHSTDSLKKALDRILIESFGKVTGPFYKVMTGTEPSEEKFEEVIKELEAFDKELSARGSTFFSGDKAGMVDYMIWPWFERLAMFKVLYGDKFAFPEQRLPTLAKWQAGMLADDAVKQYYVSPEDHARFMRTHQAGTPDFDILSQQHA